MIVQTIKFWIFLERAIDSILEPILIIEYFNLDGK